MVFLLAVLFVVLPLVEIAAIVGVADAIGNSTTVLLLVLISATGAWFAKRQGVATLYALRDGLGRGRLPTRQLVDGMAVLLAGTLLLTPGFLTDVVGVALLTPPGRDAFGRWALRQARRRVDAVVNPNAERHQRGETRETVPPHDTVPPRDRSGWPGFRPDERAAGYAGRDGERRDDAGRAASTGRLDVDPDVIDVEWAEEAPVETDSTPPVRELGSQPHDPSTF